MGRNVLVVSTVEHADDVLRAHVGEADTIKVVVPVVRQGVLDWLANDQKAFGHAERVADRTAEQLPGETVDAVAGGAPLLSLGSPTRQRANAPTRECEPAPAAGLRPPERAPRDAPT
jgi:hypothetical protein